MEMFVLFLLLLPLWCGVPAKIIEGMAGEWLPRRLPLPPFLSSVRGKWNQGGTVPGLCFGGTMLGGLFCSWVLPLRSLLIVIL